MTKFIKIALKVLLLASFLGCQEDNKGVILRHAEEYMETHPDSVIRMLKEIKEDVHYAVTVDDIKAWEAKYGDSRLDFYVKDINGKEAYAEVKGVTGQHWVAIDAIAGQTIIMMDPGSSSTDMWAQYDWRNTSTFAYFKVG